MLPLSSQIVEVRKLRRLAPRKTQKEKKKEPEPEDSVTCPHCFTFYPSIVRAVKKERRLGDLNSGVLLCRTCKKTFLRPDFGENLDTIPSTVPSPKRSPRKKVPSRKKRKSSETDGRVELSSSDFLGETVVTVLGDPIDDHLSPRRASERPRKQNARFIKDYVDK